MSFSRTSPGAVLERWNRERTAFVNAVGELARETGNVGGLGAAIPLLLPLLADPLTTVQHGAAIALGRLANHSEAVASILVEQGITNAMLGQLEQQPAVEEGASRLDRFGGQRAVLFALRSVAKHSGELAGAVLVGDNLAAVVNCALATTDAETQEGACCLLDIAAGHTPELAQRMIDSGALQLLASSLAGGKEVQQVAVQRVAASALANVCKHGEAHSRAVVEAGCLPIIGEALRSQQPTALTTPAGDAGKSLKRQLIAAIAAIAKGSSDLASAVLDAGLLPDIAVCLACDDATVKRWAAVAVREVVKAGPELAAVAADTCLPGLVAVAGSGLVPAIMAIGFIASYSVQLSARVVGAGLLGPLAAAVAEQSTEDHVRSCCAWALGQVGKHDADCAMAVAGTGALTKMVELSGQHSSSSEDLRTKCSKALKAVVQALDDAAVLAALIELPLPAPEVMDAALARCAAVLAENPASRVLFAQVGALKRAQQLGEAEDSPYLDTVAKVCAQFPTELVQLYSAKYHQELLAKLGA